jgi:hypothetical protein
MDAFAVFGAKAAADDFAEVTRSVFDGHVPPAAIWTRLCVLRDVLKTGTSPWPLAKETCLKDPIDESTCVELLDLLQPWLPAQTPSAPSTPSTPPTKRKRSCDPSAHVRGHGPANSPVPTLPVPTPVQLAAVAVRRRVLQLCACLRRTLVRRRLDLASVLPDMDRWLPAHGQDAQDWMRQLWRMDQARRLSADIPRIRAKSPTPPGSPCKKGRPMSAVH